MGRIITFSGADGSGKSTLLDLTRDQLRDQGMTVHRLWARIGYTPIFEGFKKGVRILLRNKVVPPPNRVSPGTKSGLKKKNVRTTWLVLAMLDLIWVYGVLLRWKRWRFDAVICDRYLLDSLVDLRVYFPQVEAESWLLWKLLVVLAPTPDVAFLVQVPLDVALERTGQRDEDDFRAVELQSRHESYSGFALDDGLWDILDGSQPVEELAGVIRARLAKV